MYWQRNPNHFFRRRIKVTFVAFLLSVFLVGCSGSGDGGEVAVVAMPPVPSTNAGVPTEGDLPSANTDVQGILPDCLYDSHCSGNEECILGYCTATEGIGETCFPLTPTCREDLMCRPDPAEPYLFRCFPEFVSAIDFDNDNECKRLYSPVAHDDSRTYFDGSDAATFAKSASLSVGGSGLLERGAVYSKNGEYGCYRTECIGVSSTAEVSTAISTTDFFIWDSDRFEGDSILDVASVGWSDIIGANYSFSRILSVPDDFLGQELLGYSYAYEASLGEGLPLANGALYECNTRLNIVEGPPIANAGDDVLAECSSPQGELITLDGTASYDPHGGEIQSYMWTGFFGTLHGPRPEVLFPISTEVVSLVVTDDDGNLSGPDHVSVTVADTVAPSILLQATPNILWPPNNKMVAVQISVEADDVCDPSPVCEITSVVSNEPESKAEVDWVMHDDFSIDIRAQRDGSGSGRTYSVHVGCADQAGNRSVAQVDVIVPHDQGDQS